MITLNREGFEANPKVWLLFFRVNKPQIKFPPKTGSVTTAWKNFLLLVSMHLYGGALGNLWVSQHWLALIDFIHWYIPCSGLGQYCLCVKRVRCLVDGSGHEHLPLRSYRVKKNHKLHKTRLRIRLTQQVKWSGLGNTLKRTFRVPRVLCCIYPEIRWRLLRYKIIIICWHLTST